MEQPVLERSARQKWIKNAQKYDMPMQVKLSEIAIFLLWSFSCCGHLGKTNILLHTKLFQPIDHED